MDRLFFAIPGTVGLTRKAVVSYLSQLIGPGASRLTLDDADFEAIRQGATRDTLIMVPLDELSALFTAYLNPATRKPEMPKDGKKIYALPIWLSIRPWLTESGTTTDENGNTVPTYTRKGTLIDILFRTDDIDRDRLESRLTQILAAKTLQRSDGTTVSAAESPIGVALVPASEVRTPAVVFPSWSPPEISTEPPPE